MPLTLVDPSAEQVSTSQTRRRATRQPSGQAHRVARQHQAQRRIPADLEVGDRLKRDFGCETEVIKKKTYTRFAEPHIIESLKKYDGVVTAVGD